MSNISLEFESKLAVKAVSEASLMLSDRNDVIPSTQKESLRDLVSEFDLQVEKHIINLLSKESKYPILSEEYNSEFKFSHNDIYWVIDPIDGTTNFIHGIPLFGVCVSLVDKNKHLIGAISLPASKDLFFTHGLHGSFWNGKRLKCKDSSMGEALMAISFPSKCQSIEEEDSYFSVFKVINKNSRGALRTGSIAVNLCMVSSGRLQCAIGFSAKIWDVSAGIAIAERAGASIAIRTSNKPNSVDYIIGAKTVVNSVVEIVNNHGLMGWEIS